MKKFIVLTAAVAMAVIAPIGNVQAADQGATNFTGPVQINSSTDGLGIGRDAAGRPLRIRAQGLPAAVFNIETPNGAANVFQMNTNSNGSGFMWLKTSDNVVRIQINSDLAGNSFFNAGNLGVGVTNPQAKLHVVGDAITDGTHTVDVLEILGGSDLSEQFNVDGELAEPGSVVCIDAANPGELVVSSTPYDRTVAGIISGANGLNTGMTMGQKGSVADGAHPVALTGRVYVKATAANGAIQPGDLLTTSAVPGHAMKVTDHAQAQGAILGKAMTALDGDSGMVLVLVSLQ